MTLLNSKESLPHFAKASRGKHVHFVGICGVGSSPVAIALHKFGYRVTGSDKGFYPPVSVELEEAGVEFYAGWHPEKMGTPDIVLTGGAGTSPNNPEIVEAKKHNVPVYSFAEFIGKYFVKKNSIVTTGTWGKTTCAAFLAHILTEAGLKPSYMIGGIPISIPSGALTDSSESEWSVIEGDEYQAAIWDKKAKFWYYSPTHLLLTSVSWDHADLYLTEDAYFAEFEKLVASIPEKGLIVACIDDTGVRKVIDHAKCRVVTYGRHSNADYKYLKVGESRDGIRFGIMKGKEAIAIESQIIGGFQAENITGCFVMAKEIGIPTKTIISSIASFVGIKRRFEKRFETLNPDGSGATVFDCNAPTPEKARAVLRDLRKIYPRSTSSGQATKIIAIFEPNIGGRTSESAIKYTGAFSAADTVIIPTLTKLKIDPNSPTRPIEGRDLADLIARGHSDVRYIPKDDKLVEQLAYLAAPPLGDLEVKPPSGCVIVFLGSHSFRQMIEQIVEKLNHLPSSAISATNSSPEVSVISRVIPQ